MKHFKILTSKDGIKQREESKIESSRTISELSNTSNLTEEKNFTPGNKIFSRANFSIVKASDHKENLVEDERSQIGISVANKNSNKEFKTKRHNDARDKIMKPTEQPLQVPI